MKKELKTTYRVTLNGYDFDFVSSPKAVYFMELAVNSFVPDRWHDAVHTSMELIIEKPEKDPEEPEEIEEVEDDETAISG